MLIMNNRSKKRLKRSGNSNCTPPKRKITIFFDWLNRHSSTMVAIATIMLALITFKYMSLTREIAEETKRLADISVEQFKIRSYPTFMISDKEVKYHDLKYIDKMTISNKGTISSYETSILIMYELNSINLDKEYQDIFVADNIYTYSDPSLGKIDVLDYKLAILPNTSQKLSYTKRYPKITINSIKYQLVFIRFKVPYDVKYRYSVFVYGLDKNEQDNNISLQWDILPISKQEQILSYFLTSDIFIRDKKEQIIDFFRDYEKGLDLTFHKLISYKVEF